MKRMGGGFGGKETRSVFASCAAAVAAKLSSRPVRLTLGRDVDMSITGMRHAFVAYYEASAMVTKEGAKLHTLDVKLYNNGGCALDLSGPVLDRALFHVDGCYYWPNFRAVGVPCKTVQVRILLMLAFFSLCPLLPFLISTMQRNSATSYSVPWVWRASGHGGVRTHS